MLRNTVSASVSRDSQYRCEQHGFCIGVTGKDINGPLFFQYSTEEIRVQIVDFPCVFVNMNCFPLNGASLRRIKINSFSIVLKGCSGMIHCRIPAFFIIQWRWCAVNLSNQTIPCKMISRPALKNVKIVLEMATFGDYAPLNLKKITIGKQGRG